MAQHEVIAEVTGTVWKIEVAVGQTIEAEEPVLIAESMKMEIPVLAPVGGKVISLAVAEGDTVEDGQVVAIIEAGA